MASANCNPKNVASAWQPGRLGFAFHYVSYREPIIVLHYQVGVECLLESGPGGIRADVVFWGWSANSELDSETLQP